MSGRMIRLTGEHREQVHAMRARAEQWLASKGLEQYNGANAASARAALDAELDAGLMVGWEVDGDVVAVAAIKSADRDFWQPEEANDEGATYVGRFMTRVSGHGYGEALLEAIVDAERARGMRVARLDCWRTNGALHEYYERHGFRHVRTVEVPGRMSGALFERTL